MHTKEKPFPSDPFVCLWSTLGFLAVCSLLLLFFVVLKLLCWQYVHLRESINSQLKCFFFSVYVMVNVLCPTTYSTTQYSIRYLPILYAQGCKLTYRKRHEKVCESKLKASKMGWNKQKCENLDFMKAWKLTSLFVSSHAWKTHF